MQEPAEGRVVHPVPVIPEAGFLIPGPAGIAAGVVDGRAGSGDIRSLAVKNRHQTERAVAVGFNQGSSLIGYGPDAVLPVFEIIIGLAVVFGHDRVICLAGIDKSALKALADVLFDEIGTVIHIGGCDRIHSLCNPAVQGVIGVVGGRVPGINRDEAIGPVIEKILSIVKDQVAVVVIDKVPAGRKGVFVVVIDGPGFVGAVLGGGLPVA